MVADVCLPNMRSDVHAFWWYRSEPQLLIFHLKSLQQKTMAKRPQLYPSVCVKSIQIQGFFWSVFSCIRTEYKDLLRKSLSSVSIQENTGWTRKNSRHFSRSVGLDRKIAYYEFVNTVSVQSVNKLFDYPTHECFHN